MNATIIRTTISEPDPTKEQLQELRLLAEKYNLRERAKIKNSAEEEEIDAMWKKVREGSEGLARELGIETDDDVQRIFG